MKENRAANTAANAAANPSANAAANLAANTSANLPANTAANVAADNMPNIFAPATEYLMNENMPANVMPAMYENKPAYPMYEQMPANVMPAYKQMCPWVNWQQMGYQNNYEELYPDVYHVVNPRVRQMCMMMDVPGNSELYPWPSRAAVERMTDQIYNDVANIPGMTEDVEDNMMPMGNRQIGVFSPFSSGFGFSPGFGTGFGRPRRFLRDLISILLIRQLLGRRGIYNY